MKPSILSVGEGETTVRDLGPIFTPTLSVLRVRFALSLQCSTTEGVAYASVVGSGIA